MSVHASLGAEICLPMLVPSFWCEAHCSARFNPVQSISAVLRSTKLLHHGHYVNIVWDSIDVLWLLQRIYIYACILFRTISVASYRSMVQERIKPESSSDLRVSCLGISFKISQISSNRGRTNSLLWVANRSIEVGVGCEPQGLRARSGHFRA